MTLKMRIIGLLKRSLNDFWFHCSVLYCTKISAQLNSAFCSLFTVSFTERWGRRGGEGGFLARNSGGRGYRVNFFLNISGGGDVLYSTMKKLLKKIFFRVGQVCVGKILNLYFRGKFYFFGGQFQIWWNLKSLFRGAFFSLGKFVYGKS